MITLYERSDCPFCWKVRLALAELDLDYESVATRLGEKHPELARLSPTGTVPVLVDGDTVVWESAVILEYLDGRYSPGLLFPGDAVQQARIRLLHAYSDKIVGGCLRELVFEKRSRPESDWTRALFSPVSENGGAVRSAWSRIWVKTVFLENAFRRQIAPWEPVLVLPRPTGRG